MTKHTKMGNTKFVNLCPHDVILTDGQTLRMVFEASGQVARIENGVRRESFHVEVTPAVSVSLPVQFISDGGIYGLPEPEEDTYYITSYLVAKQARRADVISPLTDASAFRGEDYKIVGVRGFQCFI